MLTDIDQACKALLGHVTGEDRRCTILVATLIMAIGDLRDSSSVRALVSALKDPARLRMLWLNLLDVSGLEGMLDDQPLLQALLHEARDDLLNNPRMERVNEAIMVVASHLSGLSILLVSNARDFSKDGDAHAATLQGRYIGPMAEHDYQGPKRFVVVLTNQAAEGHNNHCSLVVPKSPLSVVPIPDLPGHFNVVSDRNGDMLESESVALLTLMMSSVNE